MAVSVKVNPRYRLSMPPSQPKKPLEGGKGPDAESPARLGN